MNRLKPSVGSYHKSFLGGPVLFGQKQLQSMQPAGFLPEAGTKHLLVGMDRGGGPFARIIGQVVTAIKNRGLGRVLVEAEDGTRFTVESKYLKRPKV